MKNLSRHRSRLGLIAVVSALVLAVGSPQGLGQGNDEALKQRFVQEAPSRWEEYARLSEELQGVVSISHTGTLNNYQYDSRVEYNTNGRGKMVKVATKHVINGKVEQDNEEVYGFNTRYAFTLRRKTPDSPWALTNFFERNNGTDLGRIAVRLNDYLKCVTQGVRLENESLAEALRKPAFRIGDCRKVQTDGEELVEVTFTYGKVEPSGKRSLNGKLLFDPNRYWCLRSGDIQVTGDFVSGPQTIRLTQSDNAGKLPPLSRLYESDGDWVTSAGQSNRQRLRYEATLSQPSRLPADKEFTLSAFGLPEPAGVTWEKPTPFYVWVLAAAGACGVLTFGFRYLARRRQAAAA